jgi:hypothetical protein
MTADGTHTALDDPPLTTSAAHGAAPLRGIGNVPRSSIDTGRFGRLFRNLPPLVLDDDALLAVAQQMVEPTPSGGWGGTPAPGDAAMAAGWTYFAQFVDHDITFDASSLLDRANDPDALENFRTPRFDLDCLYGRGPAADPWLYDRNDPDKLLVGANPPGQGFAARDLSRNQDGRALIGDPRNDVHVIISQLHLAFVLFHNAVVERVRNDPSLVTGVPSTPVGGWSSPTPVGERPTFGQIVTLVRWHYQWLVLRHLMPRLVGDVTAGAVLPTKKKRLVPELELYSVRRNPWMPVEFSAAAYRFGHTLVRDSYQINAAVLRPVFSAAGDADALGDLRGFRRLPEGWDVEWHRFFDDLPRSGAETQRARRFDPLLSASLGQLPPLVDGQRRPLALLNLKRGVAVGLPSGEDVATEVTSRVQMVPVNVSTGLAASPLWFWLLKEAEASGGEHLGPVGGRIVAEVLVGMAQKDASSFLKVQPDWTPTLAPGAMDFTMADLLTIAGLA